MRAQVDLWYPRLEDDIPRTPDQPTEVAVGLVDVRAADEIIIDYDFERDGYRIRMETGRGEDGEETENTKLVEVAFIPSSVRVAIMESENADSSDKLNAFFDDGEED